MKYPTMMTLDKNAKGNRPKRMDFFFLLPLLSLTLLSLNSLIFNNARIGRKEIIKLLRKQREKKKERKPKYDTLQWHERGNYNLYSRLRIL